MCGSAAKQAAPAKKQNARVNAIVFVFMRPIESGFHFPSTFLVYGLASRIRLRVRSCRKVSELFRHRNRHERCETERTIRCFIPFYWWAMTAWSVGPDGPGPRQPTPIETPVAVIAR